MKEYIITAAIAAVVASVSDAMAPKEWKGYIRLLTGFLILSLLIAPVAKLRGGKMFSEPAVYEEMGPTLKNKVAEELRVNVENDAEQRIWDEFKVRAEVSAEIDVDDESNIRGVRMLTVKTGKNPEGLEERLRYVYGCEKIRFE